MARHSAATKSQIKQRTVALERGPVELGARAGGRDDRTVEDLLPRRLGERRRADHLVAGAAALGARRRRRRVEEPRGAQHALEADRVELLLRVDKPGGRRDVTSRAHRRSKGVE